MILTPFEPFVGQHCETTATGSLLKQIGIELSEPMLFGIGQGLGFGYFSFKSMPHPFIGGRLKSGEITEHLCRNLYLELDVKETTSIKKAWRNVDQALQAGTAVGLQLDCYHLEYFGAKIHFAGHFVAMYGYDDKDAYLVDTAQQGSQSRTSLESLALARNERGPMSARNKSYTISQTDKSIDLPRAIETAIQQNSHAFLTPPIKNFGYKGILKASKEIKKWFLGSEDRKRDFQTTAMLMERAGTGGSIFRNLYRDFLKESAEILDSEPYYQAYLAYREIALRWKEVADLFDQAGTTEEISHINQASEILVDLSQREQQAMLMLQA